MFIYEYLRQLYQHEVVNAGFAFALSNFFGLSMYVLLTCVYAHKISYTNQARVIFEFIFCTPNFNVAYRQTLVSISASRPSAWLDISRRCQSVSSGTSRLRKGHEGEKRTEHSKCTCCILSPGRQFTWGMSWFSSLFPENSTDITL